MTASSIATSTVRPLRVLVADGDTIATRTASVVLGLAGHDVTIATDSDDALDLLKDHGFDIALIALDLPGIGGIETAKLYRFLALGRPRMPIVALASRWTLDACARGHEAGIEQFVAKPLLPDELDAAVLAAIPAPAAPVDVYDVFGVVTPLFRRPVARAPAIDAVLLDRLKDVGGDAFVRETIEDFAAEAAATLEELQIAIRSHSLIGTQAAGRRIEELSGAVGADRLLKMGRTLARMTAAEFGLRATDYLDQVIGEHAVVAAALASRLREAPVS